MQLLNNTTFTMSCIQKTLLDDKKLKIVIHNQEKNHPDRNRTRNYRPCTQVFKTTFTNMFKESQKNMKTERNYNKELNMT